MKNMVYIAAALSTGIPVHSLEHHFERYHEIVVQQAPGIAEVYEKLTKQERIAAYYLWRAILSGNRIAADQKHRHAVQLRTLFEALYKNQATIELVLGKTFTDEIQTYLVYLWTNHSQYFVREHAHNKRTPDILQLSSITPEHVEIALTLINKKELFTEEIKRSLFDSEYEHTATVEENIDLSASNMYAAGFSNQDYKQLDSNRKGRINAYYTHTQEGQTTTELYYAQGKYAPELSTALYWFEKAYSYTQNHTETFNSYFRESLRYLIEYLKTGDEEFFKKHSIAWLNNESRLDYNYGFIEVYDDPMQTTGTIQGEITVKILGLDSLKKILTNLEELLPLPPDYKRVNRAILPNASINVQLTGTGGLGPIKNTAAYCLPNYAEIRSENGSKQIIYPAERSVVQMLNQEKARLLTHIPERARWFAQHDPDDKLFNDIDNLQTILHETLGHGSGALAVHTFKEGDLLTIQQKTYKPGDTLQVTSTNSPEFLGGYEAALEELRAEIIALYVSTHHLPELAAQGFLQDWHSKLHDDLIDWIIITMAERGMKRMITQAENAHEIAGAHAQANTTIMHYLLEQGGVQLITKTVVVENQEHQVNNINVVDREKALASITQLMQLVQHIKSTGDTQGVKALIENYGKVIKYPELFKAVQKNHKALVGTIKATARIYPYFVAVAKDNEYYISDVQIHWPDNIFKQHELYTKLELSKEL